jgi:hypothetical protein
MLSGYRGQGPVDYAFGMLDTVSQADTRWSLVYDPEKLEVHFIAKALGARKVFRLGELLTRESVWGLGGNLLDDKLGKVQALGPVSSEENADLLREVFQQISYQTGERIDYPLLYEMAMQGDQHLPQWVDGELKRELNQAIRQLPGLSPLLFPDSVFDGLADWSSYDIVGLGEATHGTKEFCQFKHRMFKYLVENHGYRVLAYEYSFRNSLSINIYVLHGEGDIDSILSGESWIQNNEEVKELIRWMRSYNAGRAYGERIQFIGIDTQVDAIRLPEVLSYLEKNHFGFCDTHRALMAEEHRLP